VVDILPHQTTTVKTAIFASVQGHEIIGVEADDVGDHGGKKIRSGSMVDISTRAVKT